MTAQIAVITYNHIPATNTTYKYLRLGPIALQNRRRYCDRHGYRFIHDVPVAAVRPACWAKIPALLQALETHSWVLWADSDALIFNQSCRLEKFCDSRFDLVFQSHESFFRLIGTPLEQGLARMPINTGVFLVQSTDWSRRFLEDTYRQTEYVTHNDIWDGIGEQEAMTALLRRNPADRRRISYVEGLQNHPRLYKTDDLFVHFYGNHASHRISLDQCEEVLRRWESANASGGPFPSDHARFHWCCIQNIRPDAPAPRADPAHYLYREQDLIP